MAATAKGRQRASGTGTPRRNAGEAANICAVNGDASVLESAAGEGHVLSGPVSERISGAAFCAALAMDAKASPDDALLEEVSSYLRKVTQGLLSRRPGAKRREDLVAAVSPILGGSSWDQPRIDALCNTCWQAVCRAAARAEASGTSATPIDEQAYQTTVNLFNQARAVLADQMASELVEEEERADQQKRRRRMKVEKRKQRAREIEQNDPGASRDSAVPTYSDSDGDSDSNSDSECDSGSNRESAHECDSGGVVHIGETVDLHNRAGKPALEVAGSAADSAGVTRKAGVAMRTTRMTMTKRARKKRMKKPLLYQLWKQMVRRTARSPN